MTTNATTLLAAKGDELAAELEQAVRLDRIAAFEKANPTGNKLVWNIEVNGEAVELDTPQTRAFLVGLQIGAAKVTAGRGPKMNAVREAILADGRVELDIAKPDDKAYMKRLRNGLFSDAYAVGLKGQFHVTRDGDKLIGETEAYRLANPTAPAPLEEDAAK